MTRDATFSQPLPADQTLQELDELLDDLSRLAQSDSDPNGFHAELIGRAVSALSAAAGAIWIRGATGRMQAVASIDLGATGALTVLGGQREHSALLESVAERGQARLVLPA